jgi:hypothetical protein
MRAVLSLNPGNDEMALQLDHSNFLPNPLIHESPTPKNVRTWDGPLQEIVCERDGAAPGPETEEAMADLRALLLFTIFGVTSKWNRNRDERHRRVTRAAQCVSEDRWRPNCPRRRHLQSTIGQGRAESGTEAVRQVINLWTGGRRQSRVMEAEPGSIPSPSAHALPANLFPEEQALLQLLRKPSNNSQELRSARRYNVTWRMVNQSYPRNRPWRPMGLWDVQDPTLSRQSAHR